MRPLNSLRLQLLSWLILPLALVVALNAWLGLDRARATAALVTDRTLSASARTIAEQVTMSEGVVDAPISPAALEMFATGDQDRVFYRVVQADGRLVTGYPELPMPPKSAGAFQIQFYDGSFRAAPVRLAALRQPVVGAGTASPVLVVVGVTLDGRSAMARKLWINDLFSQLGLVLVSIGLVWFGLERGLAPIRRLREAVLTRQPDALDPLPLDGVQTELRPLVSAFNVSVERVERHIAGQRRFIADAAHQLRTPLSLLGTQATYALRTGDIRSKDEAVEAMRESTLQLVHMVNQLLTLSRAEPDVARSWRQAVDLGLLIRRVIEGHADQALGRGIDLGFEGETGPAVVEGDPSLLRAMLDNLVDNALRYGRQGGTVTVGLVAIPGFWRLTVADDGAGIPDDERDRVFERFHRVLGTDGDGSGLGLAVVKAIVEAAGGTVGLADPAMGTGLVVIVDLPSMPFVEGRRTPADDAVLDPGDQIVDDQRHHR